MIIHSKWSSILCFSNFIQSCYNGCEWRVPINIGVRSLMSMSNDSDSDKSIHQSLWKAKHLAMYPGVHSAQKHFNSINIDGLCWKYFRNEMRYYFMTIATSLLIRCGSPSVAFIWPEKSSWPSEWTLVNKQLTRCGWVMVWSVFDLYLCIWWYCVTFVWYCIVDRHFIILYIQYPIQYYKAPVYNTIPYNVTQYHPIHMQYKTMYYIIL